MTLHLIKLAAGIDKVAALAERQKTIQTRHGRLAHITRNHPKRVAELIDGGSLYWVIKRQIRVRQRITAIESITDKTGTRHCHIILQPQLILTRPQGRRPFQGWRYLPSVDAPEDLPPPIKGSDELPPDMRAELAALGLL